MKNAIIKTTDLCKSFANNGRQNHVLDMVNLEIYEQDFTVIMGSSGAETGQHLFSFRSGILQEPENQHFCTR